MPSCASGWSPTPAARFLILVDAPKMVGSLDAWGRLPVAVVPFAVRAVARALADLAPARRPGRSDDGLVIMDLAVPAGADWGAVAARADGTTGVVDQGVFHVTLDRVLIGFPDGGLRHGRGGGRRRYDPRVAAPSLTLARAAGRLSRRLGRGGGTSLPGKLLLRMRPEALAELGAELPRGVTLVSATNGKTTTARLLSACVRRAGWDPVTNPSGANLLSGVATALLDAQGRRPAPDSALFEVDEAALAEVVRQLPPRVLLLMNLFRDQLDRYGELEHLADLWGRMVAALPPGSTPVLNADDPAIAALGQGRAGVLTFGIEDPAVGLGALPHAADSTRCRNCAAPLTYDLVTLGHLGHWRCDACGLVRPRPDVRATRVELRGTRAIAVTLETPAGEVRAELPLPGLHNAYNATAAAAAAVAMGVPREAIAAGLAESPAAFGRGERVTLDGASSCCCSPRTPRARTRPSGRCCSTPSRRTC